MILFRFVQLLNHLGSRFQQRIFKVMNFQKSLQMMSWQALLGALGALPEHCHLG